MSGTPKALLLRVTAILLKLSDWVCIRRSWHNCSVLSRTVHEGQITSAVVFRSSVHHSNQLWAIAAQYDFANIRPGGFHVYCIIVWELGWEGSLLVSFMALLLYLAILSLDKMEEYLGWGVQKQLALVVIAGLGVVIGLKAIIQQLSPLVASWTKSVVQYKGCQHAGPKAYHEKKASCMVAGMYYFSF